MRALLADTLQRLARWLNAKGAPPVLTSGQWSGSSFVDSYKRNRTPSANELMAELKNTAFTCATINAGVCASYPPRLYVATHAGQPAPKCATRPLDPATDKRLRAKSYLPARITKAERIEEVHDHPLLTLLQQVNAIAGTEYLGLLEQLVALMYEKVQPYGDRV